MNLDDFKDLGELIPGLDEFLGEAKEEEEGDVLDDILDDQEEADDGEESAEEGDDEEEESSDDATQESSDEYTEVKEEVNKDDALGQALQRLNALEAEYRQTKEELSEAQLRLQRPQFVPFDALPEDTQRMFAETAERFGVTPEQLVFSEYQRLVADFDMRMAQREASKAAAAQSAVSEVQRFYAAHPLAAKHGNDLAPILVEMGWNNIEPLAQTNPDLFKTSAMALISAAYDKAQARSVLAERKRQQQKRLKASTRSEAARPKAPDTLAKSSRSRDEHFVKEIADFIERDANPLKRLLK